MLDRHVLLLNQNYEPLSVCKARRALVLVLSRKAEMLEPSGSTARTVRMAYRLPSVLRLNYFVRVKRREVPLTKRNVLRRDGGVCQYCGRRGALMTTDHVIPRSSSGTDTWENLVCACTFFPAFTSSTLLSSMSKRTSSARDTTDCGTPASLATWMP